MWLLFAHMLQQVLDQAKCQTLSCYFHLCCIEVKQDWTDFCVTEMWQTFRMVLVFLTLTLNCSNGVNYSCHRSFNDLLFFKLVCLDCNERKIVRLHEAEEHEGALSTSFLVSLKCSSSPGVSLNICLFSSHFMKLNPSFHLLKPSATSPLSLIWSPPLPSLSPIPPSS